MLLMVNSASITIFFKKMKRARTPIFWNNEMPFPPLSGVCAWPQFLQQFLQPWDIANPQVMGQFAKDLFELKLFTLTFCHLSIGEKQKLPVAIQTRSIGNKSEK